MTILIIFILMLTALAPYVATNSMFAVSSPTPTIHVEKVSKLFHDTFDINITVTDAPNIVGYEISLTYNTTLLDFVNATNGDFLPEAQFKYTPSESEGELYLKAELYGGTIKPANGSGTLAIITFHCTGQGQSNLGLHDTELFGSTGSKIYPGIDNGACTQTTEVRDKSISINSSYTLHTDLNSSLLGPVFVIEADNVVLDLNNHLVWATPNPVGTAVEVKYRSNITIMNGNFASFQRGITIQNCNNINVTNINFSWARTTGIVVSDRSFNINIVENTIFGRRGESGEGIEISEESNVNIRANDISNFAGGISIKDSNDSKISGNRIHDNILGIWVENSFENKIWSNNFIENIDTKTKNSNHALCRNSRNDWELDYPCGGNYWDDYTSRLINDSFSGKDHTILGPDGIGDTAYKIASEGLENRDEYPLMDQCGEKLQLCSTNWVLSGPKINETRTLSASVYTDSTITDFDFNQTAGCLSFNISGGTFFRAIISRELLDGALEVRLDNVPMASFLDSDETHAFAYFNHTSGNRVEITGKIITKIDGDLNSDGMVNILDLAIVAKNYGNEIEKKR